MTIKEFANDYFCTEDKSVRQIMRELLSDEDEPKDVLGEFVDMMENYDFEEAKKTIEKRVDSPKS